MSASAGNPCISGREALAYAYQGVLLHELALMRGLQASIIPLPRVNPNSVGRPIVSSPRIPKPKGAVHDPEVTLSYGEVLDGIDYGIQKCLADRGLRPGTSTSQAVNKIFSELVDKGWLVPVPDENLNMKFKTLHGELLRLASNATPLPDRYEASGFLVLPAVLEPIAGPAGRKGLPPVARDWMRRQCPSSALADTIIDIVEKSLRNAGYGELNTYQYRVVEEYFKRRLENEHVDAVLAAPTGGGKTLAFTVIALLEVLAAKCRGEKRPAVLVYPRKTLAREQVETLARTIDHLNNGIRSAPGRVPPTMQIVVWLRDGNSGAISCSSQSDCVELPRSWGSIRGITVRGRQAVHRYDDARGLYESDPEWLIDARDNVDVSPLGAGRMKPNEAADIIVTNYDMIFKAVTDHLSGGRGSATGLWEALRGSSVIVLDEAHMVLGSERVITTQSLALALSLSGARPGFIVSSATLLSRRIFGPNTITQNYVAVELLAGPTKDEAREAFVDLLDLDPSHLVYVDYYAEASKRPRSWKLTLWATIYPSLLRKPTTALNEAIVSALHLAAGKRGHDPSCKLKTVVFIEYKSSLRDIALQLAERIVLESGDVYDRVLLLDAFDNHAAGLGKWLTNNLGTAAGSAPNTKHNKAKKVIGGMVNDAVVRAGRLPVAGVLWDPRVGLRRFHAVSPYTTPSDYSPGGPLSRFVTSGGHPLGRVERAIEPIIARATAAFPRPPLYGRLWMEHLLVHAALMKSHRSWDKGPQLEAYYNDIVRLGLDRFVPVAVHHGDYTGKYRDIADILLQKDPLTIIATSTLEVGLNIPCVAATLHYILPKQPGRILQMVGRSGREPENMRVSLGIAFLRPNAWETPKRVESVANKYFHEVEAPPSPSISKSPYNLARLCITAGLRCHDLSPALPRSASSILQTAEKIAGERRHVLDEIRRVLSKRAVPALSDICGPSANQKLSVYISMASPNTRLREALDSLHRACSYSGNQNHALTLAAVEWAYSEAVDAFQKAVAANRLTKWLEGLIDFLSTLRAHLYVISARNIASLLGQDPASTAEDLVYPRPYAVGAGEQPSPAGQVVVVG